MKYVLKKKLFIFALLAFAPFSNGMRVRNVGNFRNQAQILVDQRNAETLRADNEARRANNAEVRERNERERAETAEGQRDKFLEQRNKFKKKNKYNRSQLQNARNQIGELKTALNDSEDRVERLFGIVKGFNIVMDKYSADIRKLQDDLATTTGERDNLQTQLNDKEAEKNAIIGALNGETDISALPPESRAAVQRVNNEIDRLRGEIENKDNTIQDQLDKLHLADDRLDYYETVLLAAIDGMQLPREPESL